MKRKNNRMFAALVGLTTVLATTGCGENTHYDDSVYTNIRLEEVAHLTPEDKTSPYLDLVIDYGFFTEYENDSVVMKINRRIQQELLGDSYNALPPEEAVDSFKNDRIREYRTEMKELCAADSFDIHQTDSLSGDSPYPAWYNQTYSLVTIIDEGRSGIVTVCADTFMDTGGAHPNQWSRWMNFRFSDGSLITTEETFPNATHEELKQLLLAALIRQQAEAHPEEEIKTLENLQSRGILCFTEMYIPQNFLLGKETVGFLFNRYDIAPYSEGSIVLEVPYKNLEPYLNSKIWN